MKDITYLRNDDILLAMRWAQLSS